MSWIHDLYETYEMNIKEISNDVESEKILLPIAHLTQNVQIEISINMSGDFVNARELTKEERLTIIPVTEDSSSRTSGDSPHPLEDKLEYIAGDYEAYIGVNNNSKYNKYVNYLEEWVTSEYSCKEVEAVYKYVKKSSVISDLISEKILEYDRENNKINNKKICGVESKDCFVRFSIEPMNLMEFNKPIKLYENVKVFNSHINYYLSTMVEKDFCYITGEIVACTKKQPAKIRHAGDQAKLISANDTYGFTYRGRFNNANEAFSVGYEASQKAHNALRWLISKQGFDIDGLSIVAWEKADKNIISIEKSMTDSLFGEEDMVMEPITNEAYAKKVEMAAKGYRNDLNTGAQIVVMGVDAATTGRLSVKFYKKLLGSEFMDNILYWYKTCFWYYRSTRYEKISKDRYIVGTPSILDIANTVCGDKNKKFVKSTVERLLPCIIDKRKIPRDIVKTAIVKVSSPTSYDSRNTYQHSVDMACALIRKCRHDYKKEEWEMALDRNNRDRSYLFGRLLGAAQKLEEVALYFSGEKDRTTSAERYYQKFAQNPGKTWIAIDSKLRPYRDKLKANNKSWYIKELQDIYELINTDDFTKKEPLNELYLLGYNCQLNSYNNKSNEEDK